LTVSPQDSDLSDLWLWGSVRLPRPQPELLPADATPLDIQFADHIALAGYRLTQDGPIWTVNLYWSVDNLPQGDYIVFVHAQKGDKLIAQQDAKPLDGKLPTWAWTPGEVVTTTYTLNMSSGNPDTLYVGMYTYPSLERLAVSQNGHAIQDRAAVLWTAP
jgi:hypothetical protein